MTKPRKTKVKFGGIEIPELYTETLRGRVIYYFKNDKGNKIRREDLKDAMQELNKYKQRINMPVIRLAVEDNADKLSPCKKDQIKAIEEATGAKPYPNIKRKEGVPIRVGDSENNPRQIIPDAEYEIPKQFILDQVDGMLDKNPQLLAQELGREQIAYLDKLTPKQRYTLNQIGNYYLKREKYTPKPPLIAKNYRGADQYWKEFIRIVRVKFIDELDKKLLSNYNSELTKVAHDPQYRPRWLSGWQRKSIEGKILTQKWIKVRLDVIKTVLNNALYVVEYDKDVDNILKLSNYTPKYKSVEKVIDKEQLIKNKIVLLDARKNELAKLQDRLDNTDMASTLRAAS